MKVKNKYVDEISGREFDTADKAIESEKKNGGIKKLFSFWQYKPDDDGCRHANGEWSYQRTEKEYTLLKLAIIEAVKNYEPWIYKQYEDGLRLEHLGSGFMIGRYLSDGNSEIYQYYIILSNVCQKCFREHGQPYYANNCTHDMKVKKLQCS